MVGTAIGHVPDLPSTFAVLDPTPIRCRYPCQLPKRYAWLARYMEEQCQMGIYTRVLRLKEPDPVFLSRMVLVPKAQSG